MAKPSRADDAELGPGGPGPGVAPLEQATPPAVAALAGRRVDGAVDELRQTADP